MVIGDATEWLVEAGLTMWLIEVACVAIDMHSARRSRRQLQSTHASEGAYGKLSYRPILALYLCRSLLQDWMGDLLICG